MAPSNAGGDEREALYEYLDDVSSSLTCAICRDTLADPLQTPCCEQLFCRTCLQRALSLVPTCPVDRTPLPGGINACARAPRVVRELLGELRVQCVVCKEKMQRGDWRRHAEGCRDSRGEEGEGRFDGDGTSRDGEGAHKHLEGEGQATGEELTGDPTPSAATTCTYCSLSLSTSRLPTHVLSCPSIPSPCPHASFGCPARYPRSELASLHLDSGECAYEPLKSGLDRARERWDALERENWELKQRVGVLDGTVGRLAEELAALRAAMGDFLPSPATDRSAGDPAENPRLPCPSLSSTLSALSATQTSLSTSLTSLSTSHSAHLTTTQHQAEELGALRHAVGGLRGLMGSVLGEVQRLSLAHGAGAGYGAGPYGQAAPGPGLFRSPTAGGAGGSDSGGEGEAEGGSSGSDDESLLTPPLPWSAFPRPLGPLNLAYSATSTHLPLPPSMRPVFPPLHIAASIHPGVGADGNGMMWSGGGGAGLDMGSPGGKARGGRAAAPGLGRGGLKL